MFVYDVIHGYQPFTNDLISDWVHTNLDTVFTSTSRAMAAGVVRRSVQLQGWTLDAWLNAPREIGEKAQEVISDLRAAAEHNHIEFGFSAYGHALLPLLSDELAYAQMCADYETVKTHLGEPKFFWYPECAVDSAKLRVLYDRFPGIIAVIPNKAVGLWSSGFAKVRFGGAVGKAAFCNVLVKDVVMNSVVYEKPDYVPRALDWDKSRDSMKDSEAFKYVLHTLDDDVEHVLVRDWENGESREALRDTGGMADVGAMLDSSDIRYRLLSEQGQYTLQVDVGEVRPSCWEPTSTDGNPYPYWTPSGVRGWRRTVVDCWLKIIAIYETGFKAAVESEVGGFGCDEVDEALGNHKFMTMFKETCPCLLSCLPWHLLAREEWERFPDFPGKLLEKIVLPETTKLLEYAGCGRYVKMLDTTVTDFQHAIGKRPAK
jgi:hypothetical protein